LNPACFDGEPPVFEPEQLLVASLSSLTGVLQQMVIGQTTVEKMYFYINDHLGTPRMLTDETGAVVWKADYKPSGEAVVDTASTADNRFRFPGQYLDYSTNLHYNYHRYYHSGIWRSSS
jgi:uncharacterized protein RhaS with RHS repeats